MKLLVTGALGFIGGSVARHAFERGHEVLGLARPEDPAPHRAPGFPITHLDGSASLTSILAAHAPDAVLHAAGKASVGASMSAPGDDFEGSVLTFQALLEAVRASGLRPRVILPSSAAVYGDPGALPVAEDAPAAPISPYGFHKRIAEILADEYAACFGLDVVVARLFSVFGPAQRRLLLWEIYAQLAGPGDEAWLDGTGAESRDFLPVSDVAEALIQLADRPRRGRPRAAEILNVASGEERTVLEIASAMRDLVAPHKRITCRGHERPGDPKRWRADITRLLDRAAPFRPRPFADALRACVEAWRADPLG